ncbi:FtsX-like permease family protein [Paenibacillus filicis]|uniref:Putative hemin transport system permease protein HrtB n=1 Tax=Paenibacillus filicis TaxID=669464 RepID=A0ABU9DC28_9BACL
MNGWMLILRNVLHRKTLSLLTVLAVAITISLFVLLLQSREAVEQGAQKGYGPFELVIGADGSESQLVLHSFYRLGTPTGNIPHSVLESLQREPEIEAAYAMTAGDQFNGFPIIGIDPGYFQTRYADRSLAQGHLYKQLGEVTVGYEVARKLNVRVGDEFHGGHGLVESHSMDEDEHGEEEHDAHASFSYHVVGILPKLNTADDRTVFTTVDHAWAVHAHQSEQRDVTAVLVKPRSLLGAQMVKLKYDKLEKVQAVYASKAVGDVLNFVDTGTQLILIVMLICVLLAAVSLLLSLTAAVQERKKDVGLLRLIGKSRSYILGILVGEGALLTAAGLVLGLVAGHLIGWLISDPLFIYAGIRLGGLAPAGDLLLLTLGTLVLGAVASLIPAARIYRVDALTLFRH